MPSERSSTLPRVFAAVAASVALVAGSAACSPGSQADTASRPPVDARPTTPSSAPIASSSPVDQKLINLEFQFCLETDQVVRREAPLLQPPISDKEAKQRLSQAQLIAETQVDAFANAGYKDFARQMKAWADGFSQGRRMIDNGARPVDALHPAVHSVSILFRKINCQGDA